MSTATAAPALPPFVKKANKTLEAYTMAEVNQHKDVKSLWIVIDSYVFDCTSFLDMHPGGAAVMLDESIAGRDSTEAFFSLHRSNILTKYSKLLIGQIANQKSQIVYPTPGALSTVPFAEPAWLLASSGFKSPYFTEGHRKLAMAMRDFVDNTLAPEAREHELSGERPSDFIIRETGRLNIAAMRIGVGPHLNGLILPGGMKGEDFDYLAELVVTQELARMGARGYQDGFGAGSWIGLTPIVNYGTVEQKKLIAPILAGDKYICLAITEPFAGSDVAGIRTTAKLTADKKHFVVNGAKKWITTGMHADWFTTAVRTGPKTLSMLLIPRCEGVETKAISTSYSKSAGTAYVTFDNVLVPVENLIGQMDKGFPIILSNFTHERNVMNMFCIRQSRYLVEETLIWATNRKAFGKSLMDQPVLRAKFAKMFAKCDSNQAWLEHITYQMCHMTYDQQSEHLSGPVALLKAYSTACAEEIVSDCVNIFGGRGVTRGGLGGLAEMMHRTSKFDAILGGSEEILADLGVRMASKRMPLAVL